MNRKLLRHIAIILSFSFVLIYCLSPLSAYAKDSRHYLQVLNSAEFSRFASSLPKHLIQRDIIKNENSWEITTQASIEREQMGLQLFNMLDSSFLQIENPHAKPTTSYFKDGYYSNLVLSPNSFTFNRGTDIFKAEVIAKLNWDKKGKEDWLVFFSLTNPRSDLVGRYFYLVITDITKDSIKSEVLAAQNNLTGTFTIYADEMPEYKIQQMLEDQRRNEEEARKQAEQEAKDAQKAQSGKQKSSKSTEAEQTVLELDRGQYSILEEPQKASTSTKKGNTEIKLSN